MNILARRTENFISVLVSRTRPRSGTSTLRLFHLGNLEFFPPGVPGVRIRFEREGHRIAAVTVHDPQLVLQNAEALAANGKGAEAMTALKSFVKTDDQDARAWFLLGRTAIIDRLILRLAIYELLTEAGTPAKVIINEALELARTFSGEEPVPFINGVLDAVRKTLNRE